jgi:hypothetical protein
MTPQQYIIKNQFTPEQIKQIRSGEVLTETLACILDRKGWEHIVSWAKKNSALYLGNPISLAKPPFECGVNNILRLSSVGNSLNFGALYPGFDADTIDPKRLNKILNSVQQDCVDASLNGFSTCIVNPRTLELTKHKTPILEF